MDIDSQEFSENKKQTIAIVKLKGDEARRVKQAQEETGFGSGHMMLTVPGSGRGNTRRVYPSVDGIKGVRGEIVSGTEDHDNVRVRLDDVIRWSDAVAAHLAQQPNESF